MENWNRAVLLTVACILAPDRAAASTTVTGCHSNALHFCLPFPEIKWKAMANHHKLIKIIVTENFSIIIFIIHYCQLNAFIFSFSEINGVYLTFPYKEINWKMVTGCHINALQFLLDLLWLEINFTKNANFFIS